MKKQILFLNLILATLLGLMITSCSKDNVTSINDEKLVIKPAKAPDFSVYSGGNALYTTLAKAMNRSVVSKVGDFTYTKYNWSGDLPTQFQAAMPKTVSTDEMAFVKQYIKDHPDEAGVKFYNINYFIQYAGGSYDEYAGQTMLDQNKAQHSVVGTNQMDYIEINGKHINDYNANWGPDALCQNLPMVNPAYHDSWGNVDNTKYDSYKIYKISYGGQDCYYLGFDYKTKKRSGEYYDGDGVYNDYVIKLTPADDTTYGNESQGGDVNTTFDGEVEVNLSVNAEKSEGDYIATKLSIHVRDTTDVEVFIPATAEYYCQADDVNVVLSHKLNAAEYNNVTNTNSMNYKIAGQTITFTVAYELGGIRVTTSGINAIVLKYLRETYGDGITFEVWNYYNNSVTINGTTSDVTRGMLKNQFLNNSTVKFTSNPGQYVNAFGSINDYGGVIYEKADDEGVRTPYTDKACTQILDAQYWDRLESDPRYYVIHSTVNAWDCVVVPTDASYTLKATKLYNKIYQK